MMTNPQRKRGVRASRTRLAHALTGAGLKTQAALAERMADIEGLELPPKDVVSRVFRELPVDPTTIERVARALAVDAHTLYKTADEEDALATDITASVRRRPALVASLIAVVVILLGSAAYLQDRIGVNTESGNGASKNEQAIPAALSMGTPTLAIIPFANDDGGTFANALRNVLNLHFNVATPTADALTQSRDPVEAATRLRTDAVVDGEFVKHGRLSAVRIYLYRAGVRQQVWGDSAPIASLQESLAAIAAESAVAVRKAVGMPVPANAVAHFPLASIQDDYLEGERYLDAPSNELNVKRAQTRFEAALRQDANYARAHAGLCQTLLEEHWMDSEERALTDAALACGQALQLDPDDAVVAAAHAHFLSRTGRNDEAIELYEQMLGVNTNDAAALAGLAASKLEAYRASGNRALLLEAKGAARKAGDADPFVWKPLFSLATMEWFDGNVPGAIAASEAALERNENEYILANLGSFYLCDGEFDNARIAYERARELNPQSYVGDEFLGQAHYFLGDFRLSAELRQKAIDSVANGNPEIHEMWGNLGDSYRQAGDMDKAMQAYFRAAEIAERDYLRGTVPVGDRAARAYYYTMLADLDEGSVPAAVRRSIDDEIDAIATELVSASSLRRMAQTYLVRGDVDKARRALDRATASCKGYARLPDLAALQ